MLWSYERKNCLCIALNRLLPFFKLDTLLLNSPNFPGGSMEHFSTSISDDDSAFPEINGHCSSNEDIMDSLSSSSEDVVMKEDEGGGGPGGIDLDEIDALLVRCRGAAARVRAKPLGEAPEFVKRLNAFVEAEAGSTVTFVCQWKAFPKPSVKWFHDDEDISDSPGYEASSSQDGTEQLSLVCANKKDEGAYKCKVENAEGVASTTGYLSVAGDISNKTLSAQHRKTKSEHSISTAPHLRTIVEQKSVEEREAEADHLEPSPLQTFIDDFQNQKTYPHYPVDLLGDQDSMSVSTEDSSVPGESAGVDATSSSSDTTVDSQDYDRLSLNIEEETDQNASSISATSPPSQSMKATEKVEKFLQEQDQPQTTKLKKQLAIDIPKIDYNQDARDSGENMTPTPTNTLDEPLFDQESLDVNSVHYVAMAPSIPQDSDDEILVAKENSATLPRPVGGRRKSQTPELELREIPRTMSKVFADQLDLPWMYYCLAASCVASFAAATEMPVPYFVMIVALCSLVSFRFVFHESKSR